ncbi:MAG: hypothetical protein BWY86_01496 [Candidatus Aminicenantes bacterium ADurb.Bin508]|nr:MAG: hypothetical protein BWY86_01496 [Candidatus Aminicenantes bacterium ADurb.Bin508]
MGFNEEGELFESVQGRVPVLKNEERTVLAEYPLQGSLQRVDQAQQGSLFGGNPVSVKGQGGLSKPLRFQKLS